MYIDVIFSKEYNHLVKANNALDRKSSVDRNRTLFLCYEDLERSPNATKAQVLDFLYPGDPPSRRRRQRNDFGSTWESISGGRRQRKSQRYLQYEGGHATSHDPELRQRLRASIETIDTNLFGNRVALAQAKLNCGA